MRGKSLLGLFLSLVSINFVSAAFYGSFSLSDSLNSVDPSTMVLGVIFIISALLINTALTRVNIFKDNKNVGGVISISLALLIIWGVNKTGLDYYSFFNGILFFIPEGFLEMFWPIAFLLGLGIMFWKFGIAYTLMIVGALISAGSFFAYESNTLLAIGGGIFFLGLFIALIKFLKKKDKGRGISYPGFGNPAKQVWNVAKNAGAGLGRGAGGLGKKALQGVKNAPGNWNTRKRRKAEKWQKKEAEKEYKRDERRRERQADIGLGKAKAGKQEKNDRFWRRKRGDEKVEKEYNRRKAEKEQQAQQERTQQKQQQQQERAQAQQQKAKENQQAAQAQQQKVAQKQLVMDFKALKKQIIETQRTDPKNPNLEGWIKQLKKMKKQM